MSLRAAAFALVLFETLVLSPPASAEPLQIADPPAASGPAPTGLTLGIGVGAGGLGAAGKEPFSQAAGFSLQLGYELSPELELLFDGQYATFARYRPDPSLSQQQAALTLGVRWWPLSGGERPRRIALDPERVALKLGAGVGHLIQVPYGSLNPFEVEQGPWGPAVTVGAGWYPVRGPGFEVGLEASHSTVHYDGDDRSHFVGGFMLRILP